MAAESESPITRTASTCTPQAARGTHTFTIAGFSHLKETLGAGRCVRSAAFIVGGYQWCVKYFPGGDYASRNTLRLELMTRGAEVRAHFDFRLVDHATGRSTPTQRCSGTLKVLFRNTDASAKNDMRSTYISMKMMEETLPPPPPLPESSSRVQVPPPPPLESSSREKRGTDVTFKVKDEAFSAHKIILAMRSPVFNAAFYGPMAETNTSSSGRCVEVEDMHPDVFRALLHFIYTDSMLPAMEDGVEESRETIEHLLAAADRYDMGRLKLICEDILCKSLDVENVATTLALAELHHCGVLRDACVELIATTNSLDQVVASQGYLHLRQRCPSVVVDMLENVTKWMHSHKR
ncbi:hypothetical protein QOZ80_6AG0509660 [Eleusine coracana subsp. coracana]|nr:hypothetical protein QOZ80_6AG0509660 [Eleusine coracana subsp. coracana]